MTDINPEIGTRNWQQLVVIKDGVAVQIDNGPLSRWTTDSGQRPSDEWLASQGYYGLVATNPPSVDEEQGYNRQTNVDSWAVDEETKTVLQGWETVYYTDEQKTERVQAAWNSLRAERNIRLAACDWTQLADSPVTNGAEWKSYRQELRDLPSVTVDPRQPQWPIAPQ